MQTDNCIHVWTIQGTTRVTKSAQGGGKKPVVLKQILACLSDWCYAKLADGCRTSAANCTRCSANQDHVPAKCMPVIYCRSYCVHICLLCAGTFVDGQRLSKRERRHLLFNDSTISFGLSPLQFKIIGDCTQSHVHHDTALCYDDVNIRLTCCNPQCTPCFTFT